MQLFFSARTSERHSTAETIAHHSAWWLMALGVLGIGMSSHPRALVSPETQPAPTAQPVTDDSVATNRTDPGSGINPPPISRQSAWQEEVLAVCGRSTGLGVVGAAVQSIIAPKWCELIPLAAIGARIIPSSSHGSNPSSGDGDRAAIMGDADNEKESGRRSVTVIASGCPVMHRAGNSQSLAQLLAGAPVHAILLSASVLDPRRYDANR